MFSDSQLHYAPNVWESWKETNYAVEAADWMVQMTRLQASKIVEVPTSIRYSTLIHEDHAFSLSPMVTR